MSCTPRPAISKDVRVYRGSNKSPFKLRFKNPDGTLQDLTGADLVLTVTIPDGLIIVRLSDGGLTFDGEFVEWTLSAMVSRSIPTGRLTRYAIERVDPDGLQYPVLTGYLIGVDYPNVD